MKNINKTLKILPFALAAVFASSLTLADDEITAELIHESAQFTNSGTNIGDNVAHGKDYFKSETRIKFFADGDLDKLQEGASYHIELQGFHDGKAVDGYDSPEPYTQNEILREAYIDGQIGDWSVRAGKQQVVWGTADGIKLLDLINPTDYSEVNQNSPEDARISTWMLNAEKEFENGGNFQAILSQPRENIFAGLNRDIDTSVRANDVAGATAAGIPDIAPIGHNQGAPFIFKGVDSITGARNGFLNIIPDLGSIATGFSNAFGAAGLYNAPLTVGGFIGSTMGQINQSFGGAAGSIANLPANFQGALNNIATQFGVAADTLTGEQVLGAFTQPYASNLFNGDGELNSAFEYLTGVRFGTFDAFSNIRSQYVYDLPDNTDANLAFRWKNSTDKGLNYSFNYSYNYDTNPRVDLSYRNDAGEELRANIDTANGNRLVLTNQAGDTAYGAGGALAAGAVINGTTITATAATPAIIRFTQTLERVHNIGGSLDYALDTKALGPVVFRVEGLYQKDVYSPIVDRTLLDATGDFVSAFELTSGDRFKYVLGAEITVATNLLISAQFIQDRNLDYVDSNGKYTGDFSTLHLTNGLLQAEKNKNFVSLFLSKPFGASLEHRVNNIIIFEDQGSGGYWNRFDVEYTFNDDLQFTTEWNRYWGEENSQFGQLDKSSNIQLGLKYTF